MLLDLGKLIVLYASQTQQQITPKPNTQTSVCTVAQREVLPPSVGARKDFIRQAIVDLGSEG